MIDIHAHVKRDRTTYNYLEQELLDDMKKNNITSRVVSAIEGKSIQDQNNYIADFVSRYPDQLIGCAVINPKEDNSIDETRRVLTLPGIKMIEFNSLEHGYYPDSCPNLDPIFDILEENRIPVKVFTGIGARSMPQQWAVHAKRHPNLPFIFLHIGCFDYGYGCVDVAAENENIYVETSYQYEIQVLRKAFSTLPKEKLLFGSSYPTVLTKSSVNVFDMFDLEKDYLNSIYYKNAAVLLE
ncbi:amidohydrolase family protein [Neobacillus niacini]|uniref:amidohydrolase family protein n=1 Tax=Neobacillus niacini TaxID=86668 RepID=UPI00068B0FA8|nr:amidohydrolase family protein [Neobacillus niacini]MEC1523833.1 amidohydrolase family protein [Neobacillus niacini]